jgi:hypothetical protein
MSPNWNRIAQEIEGLARDRGLAASVEPDPRERAFLVAEARLLSHAADLAASGPGDGLLAHRACEGVVVHCDRFVLWGIGEQAERDLRALAEQQGADVALPDSWHLLATVLGVPADGGAMPEQHTPLIAA